MPKPDKTWRTPSDPDASSWRTAHSYNGLDLMGFVIPARLPKRNLVPQVHVLFILSAMSLNLRLWLLALFLATLGLTSCLNQECIAPAGGELKVRGGDWCW